MHHIRFFIDKTNTTWNSSRFGVPYSQTANLIWVNTDISTPNQRPTGQCSPHLRSILLGRHWKDKKSLWTQGHTWKQSKVTKAIWIGNHHCSPNTAMTFFPRQNNNTEYVRVCESAHVCMHPHTPHSSGSCIQRSDCASTACRSSP